MIEISNVVIQYPDRSIGPLSVHIHQKERVAILGPSGVGKSTLLNLMSGIAPIHSGRVFMDGLDVSVMSLRQLCQRRAVLPQTYDTPFNLDVGLIVSLARVARQNMPVSMKMIEASLDLVRASHLIDRPFHELSGGEKARVQLARVFCQLWDCESGYLMMDEPIASLDPGLQVQILEATAQFCSERGLAMIAVMHDMNYAVEYFERLVLMTEDGRLKTHYVDEELTSSFEELYGVPVERLERPNQCSRYMPTKAISI